MIQSSAVQKFKKNVILPSHLEGNDQTMSRIRKKFTELKKRGEVALIPFVTAGDPNLRTTLKIMRAVERGGADSIELGVPFSDPTADGPTIQRSSERAVKQGVTLPQIFHLVRDFR